MENNQAHLPSPRERIQLGKVYRRSTTRFFAFLTCIAILIAAFATSGVWLGRESLFGKDETDMSVNDAELPNTDMPLESPKPDDADKATPVPEGATAILSLDLSFQANHLSILQNETLYRPNIEEIKNKQSITISNSNGPLVLILHTHASEAYLSPQTSYLTGNIGQEIYSNDQNRSVISVGEALCESLKQNGISAIHCSDQHGKNGTLQNSYQGSADCIEKYLKKYPSIQYVIDIHRDGILSDNGELVRTIANHEGESYGQIMAVVGTDGNGTEYPNWQPNLSLALRLNERLESCVENICRPTSLRNASYNQELAPNALLLEIGSAGNTQEEAIRSAELVGKVLSDLIKQDRLGN